MTDKIEFGAGFTAEPRGDEQYYITHPNSGGAMASLAEAALIRAVVAARAERDAAQETAAAFNWLAAQMHKGSLSVMAWPSEITLHAWEGSTIRKFTGATLAEAVRAAQAGGPQ